MKIHTFNPRAVVFEPHQSRTDVQSITHATSLNSLPTVVLITIIECIEYQEILQLSQVSRRIRAIIALFVIPDRYRQTLKSYKTKRTEFMVSSPVLQLIRLEQAHQHLCTLKFSINEEARWPQKTMPILRANADYLLLASGHELWAKSPGREWSVFKMGIPGAGDISAIATTKISDEILLGFVDGRIQLVKLPGSSSKYGRPQILQSASPLGNMCVEAMDFDHSTGATLSAFRNGQVKVNQASFDLDARPWCSRFIQAGCITASGCKSKMPLVIHDFGQAKPRVVRTYSKESSEVSSVYAIRNMTPATILSAWYDGTTRLHDLRSAQDRPATIWRDAFDDSASYSLATLGNTIFTGSAQNCTVRIYDIRKPSQKLYNASLFLGGKIERGPVYSLVAEHEKLFGATETSVRSIDFWHTSSDPRSIRFAGLGTPGCYFRHGTKTELRYSL